MRLKQLLWIVACWPCLFGLGGIGRAEERRVPAFTAYILPDPRGARVSEQRGITRWTDPDQSIHWYGNFPSAGALKAKVEVRLTAGDETRLQLSIGRFKRVVDVKSGPAEEPILVDFGTFQIDGPGYQDIALAALDEPGQPLVDVLGLLVDGAAAKDAHFNLKERRNAASVHLMYPVPAEVNIAGFYCEVTAIEDPVATFYMACGWHRGYFGMQVNSPIERRIIFSVWDSGNEAVDRKNVIDENRVKLLGKGDAVYAGDFGNEGTGGHSHLKTMWVTGEPQRFFIQAEPVDKTFTTYSGYWYRNDAKEWMLISSWKAPKEGGWLKRPHSFSENFGGDTGHLLRKALYGNQWIRTDAGRWIELIEARFSHDPTGRSDRLDRFMGVEKDQFFLSHGGFIDGTTTFNESFTRPARGTPPTDCPK